MIDEDLRTARRRARRWDELNERRTVMDGLMREAQRELDAVGVWDQESMAVEEARLGAYTTVLSTLERELAEVGPARELYEELLLREERRLIGSADPRGAELLEIGRLLAELDVELPATERARAAGHAVLRGGEEAVAGFIRRVAALGMTLTRRVGELQEVVARLEERCRELGHLRDRLRARREELLLG
ncbi:hypothetical protein [Nonomuraea insulae]|uniref:Uncharacterized protein n=1 Tax=Nonomuraea insulae TaxID=1616787 RepID=A0ABW1D2T2_9ACTN